MTDKPTWKQIQEDRDKRVVLSLEPDEALRGLIEVDPDPDPEADAESAPHEQREKTPDR